MDTTMMNALQEMQIDKESFLELFKDEARKAISNIVNSSAETLEFNKGKLTELRVMIMRLTKNRVSITNLGELAGTDPTDWD